MITLHNIEKIYKSKNVETKALRGINLNVKSGEFLMIHGTSGSGKTTLLNIIGLMDTYTNGSYNFKDKEIKSMNFNQMAKFRNSEIGFVFQSFNLISDMTVLENVEVPLGYGGVKRNERIKASKEILIKVGLEDKFKSFPNQLSGGQHQRVAIARALVTNPSIILADEPTGNLDSKTSIEIMDLLKDIHNNGTTIIMITHNSNLLKYSTRNVAIEDGKIVS